MGTKRFLLLSFVAVFLLQPSFSQEEARSDSPDYKVVTGDNGEEYIVQHFERTHLEDITGYEFNLEVQGEDGEFVPYEGSPFFTEDNFIEVALPAGEYRYTVTVLNFFGRRAYTTNPVSVEILKAYRPELNSVSPSSVYLDEGFDGTFTLSGRDLMDDSTVSLVDSAGEVFSPYEIRLEDDGRRAEIFFDGANLDTGDYVLRVENPGGFSAWRDVRIRFRKPFDLDVCIGYSPLFLMSNPVPDGFGFVFAPLSREREDKLAPDKKTLGLFRGRRLRALFPNEA